MEKQSNMNTNFVKKVRPTQHKQSHKTHGWHGDEQTRCSVVLVHVMYQYVKRKWSITRCNI